MHNRYRVRLPSRYIFADKEVKPLRLAIGARACDKAPRDPTHASLSIYKYEKQYYL